jgi:hypothetical protein
MIRKTTTSSEAAAVAKVAVFFGGKSAIAKRVHTLAITPV